ncbi:MAG: penicillin-binding protein 2, partial [Armatimonadetes bacterium]|nr:penicillin-binding protein 2 [Armatimonadota bacterium]
LTVDWDLQKVVEDALEQCWDYEQPDQATVLVMEPDTGAILAMAARPNYDPNLIASAAGGIARVDIPKRDLINLTVSREYEPGSTFKVLLAAAALDTGAVTLGDTFVCPGTMQLGGKPLKCWGRWATIGHGGLNLADTIAKSCNVCAAQIAVRIGAERYCEFLRRCGISQRTRVGLPGETDGRLQAPDDMYKRDVANIGFGQNVAVTDVQLIAGICAVVNGGRLMRPYVVDRVLNPDGTTYRQVEPALVRRVCSQETSRTVRRMLRGVVEKSYGTGQGARIPGVAVGGKTGTAQIWDPQRKKYRENEHMLSFVLVAPVDTQPQFVILVTVRNAKKGQYVSQVAIPVARQVAVYMLRERDLIPPEALPKLNSS